MKPVRSLDSLRSAWSGHLRHGPPPSTVIANPSCQVASTKPISSSSYSFPSDNPICRPNATLNTPNASIISGTEKAFTFNSLSAQSNRPAKGDKTSLLSTSSIAPCDQTTESNQFLHELHNDLMKVVIEDSSSCIHDKEITRSLSEGKFSLENNERFNSKDILTNIDSISGTWDNEPFDKPFTTSSFLHEASENDPFDTSKVFTPSYLHTTLFKSTIPSIPVQFHHPLPHPFNTTSCSAHVKVNIIIRSVFYVSIKCFDRFQCIC